MQVGATHVGYWPILLQSREFSLLLVYLLLGLFLMTALFGICSKSLMRMDGSEIRVLFDTMATAKADWFKSFLFDDAEDCSWEQFVRGWVHATAALQWTTPRAFRADLLETEAWAVAVGEVSDDESADGSDGFLRVDAASPSAASGERRASLVLKEKVKEKGEKKCVMLFALSGGKFVDWYLQWEPRVSSSSVLCDDLDRS